MVAPSSHPTTLFVRNLSPNSTKGDLEAHFSAIGPLRRAVVVTENDTGLCRGFGFVHFALAEHATDAITKLSGSFIKGRKISIDKAIPRQRNVQDGDGGLIKKQERETEKKKKYAGKKGAIGMRTVVVKRHDGDNIDLEEIKVKLSEKTQDIMITKEGKEARCVFENWSTAGKGAAILHGKDYDACIEALKGGKDTRLIIRNLPFRCNLQEVTDAFSKYAPVREVKLQSTAGRNMKEKKIRKHAKGKKRTQASDDENVEHTKETAESVDTGCVDCAGFGFAEYFLVADAKFAMSKMNGSKIGGRVIAVDMALGKRDYDKELQAAEDNVRDKGKPIPSAQNTQSNENTITLDDEDVDVVLVDEPKEEKNLDKGDEITAKRPAHSTSEEMERTVFVRNLLFETSAPELWKTMEEEFGSVEQAVLVRNPITKRPRGTAFVRFSTVESAEKAVARCGKGDTSASRKANDAVEENSLVLQGRALLISKAVDRSKAKDLDIEARSKGKKDDPRNLRLAWIGYISPESKEAKGLSEQDLKRRENSVQEKKTKLSRNPNAFISDVRLNVRNIPKEFDDKLLKQMFLAALGIGVKGAGKKKKFHSSTNDSDVKEEQLSTSNAPVRIVYCKIILDEQRKDRSKGYGFVEFDNHNHALLALKALNNNPNAIEMLIDAKPKVLKIDDARARLYRKQWGQARRLQVEFSVEDRRKVQIIERIKEKGRKLAAEHKRKKEMESTGNEDDAPARKKRKQTKQRNNVKETNEDKQKLSKSEKKAALKRKRAHAIQTKKATEDSVGEDVKRASEQETEAGTTRKRRSEWDGEGDMSGTRPKPKRKKRKINEKEKKREEKLDSLVSAYKRRLEKGMKKINTKDDTKAKSTQAVEVQRWFDE